MSRRFWRKLSYVGGRRGSSAATALSMNIPMPCQVSGGLLGTEGTYRAVEELPRSRGFEAQAGADQPQARGPVLKDGPGAVGSYDFVVSHVDEKDGRLLLGAVAGDLEHDVRVDRRHRRIDDLESHTRIAVPQHHFQDPAEVESGIRHALCSRLSKNEDPNRPGTLAERRWGSGLRAMLGGKNRHPNL